MGAAEDLGVFGLDAREWEVCRQPRGRAAAAIKRWRRLGEAVERGGVWGGGVERGGVRAAAAAADVEPDEVAANALGVAPRVFELVFRVEQTERRERVEARQQAPAARLGLRDEVAAAAAATARRWCATARGGRREKRRREE
jgi:hypothetical protein